MSEKRQPWLKWYPADWRADPKLRMCSAAARGVWIDMLGFMHEADAYGHLVIAETKPDPSELAILIGVPLAITKKALEELERRGVFSRTEDGTIYSRRMVRDKTKADQDRENGKGGGNPKLKPPDNPEVFEWVNPPDKAQIPDARDQIPGSGFTNPRSPRASKADPEEFERWYAAFPRHESRAHAEQAFVKARKTASLEELIAGAERYGATVDRRENGRFVKLPATWLNAQCWLDESPGAASINGISERRKPRMSLEEAQRRQGLDRESL